MDNRAKYMMGQINRDKPQKVFDWDKAAKLIRDSNSRSAYAGLEGDWDYTNGTIYCNNKPLPKSEVECYLSSNWATPQLVIDGDFIDCYRLQDEVPDWGSGTVWPESALKILRGEA